MKHSIAERLDKIKLVVYYISPVPRDRDSAGRKGNRMKAIEESLRRITATQNGGIDPSAVRGDMMVTLGPDAIQKIHRETGIPVVSTHGGAHPFSVARTAIRRDPASVMD